MVDFSHIASAAPLIDVSTVVSAVLASFLALLLWLVQGRMNSATERLDKTSERLDNISKHLWDNIHRTEIKFAKIEGDVGNKISEVRLDLEKTYVKKEDLGPAIRQAIACQKQK